MATNRQHRIEALPWQRALVLFGSSLFLLIGMMEVDTLWAASASQRAKSAANSDSNSAEFFEKEIRPLLADRCFQCHGGRKKIEASLKLTSRADILHGGDDGPAVVPGKPEESWLIKAVRYEGKFRCPPREN